MSVAVLLKAVEDLVKSHLQEVIIEPGLYQEGAHHCDPRRYVGVFLALKAAFQYPCQQRPHFANSLPAISVVSSSLRLWNIVSKLKSSEMRLSFVWAIMPPFIFASWALCFFIAPRS